MAVPPLEYETPLPKPRRSETVRTVIQFIAGVALGVTLLWVFQLIALVPLTGAMAVLVFARNEMYRSFYWGVLLGILVPAIYVVGYVLVALSSMSRW